MKQVFVRGHRLSATALLMVDGVVASTVVEGSMTCTKYVEFLELMVVCDTILSLILESSSCMVTFF